MTARARLQAKHVAVALLPAVSPEAAKLPSSGAAAHRAVATRMPVTQHLLSKLQGLIVSGEWAPGSRLAAQRELAEQFGVSRATLREAVSSLEAFGLISVEPGRGVFVKSAEDIAAATSPQVGAAVIEHSNEAIYEARFLMEGWAAALAALSITDEQLEQLGEVVDGMQQALADQDHSALDRLDFEFHRRIVDACPNTVVRALLAPVFSESDMSNAPIADSSFISTRVKEHRDIVKAITTRDPVTAQNAMRQHVQRSAKRAHVKLAEGFERLLP